MTYKSYSIAAFTSLVVLALLFAVAMPVKALTIPAPYDGIFDGQTESWTNPGDRIQANGLVKIASGEVFHAFSTDVIGDSLPRECHDISNVQGEIERNYTFDHREGPPNTGDYGFRIVGYKADNMNQANSLKGDAACTGDSVTLYSENNVVHIVADGSNGDDNNNSNVGSVSYLQQLIADLTRQVGCLMNGQDYDQATKQCKAKPVPAKPAYCDQIKNYSVYYGQKDSFPGGPVSQYQNFLISNGFGIPAGATGGYYSQTQAAATAMGNACR